MEGALYVAFVASEGLVPLTGLLTCHVSPARSPVGARTFVTTQVFEAPDKCGPAHNKGPLLAVMRTARIVFSPAGATASGRTNILPAWRPARLNGEQMFSEPVDISGETNGDYPVSRTTPGDAARHLLGPSLAAGGRPQDTPVHPIYHRSSTDGGQTLSERTTMSPGNQEHEKPPLIPADPDSCNLYVVSGGIAEQQNPSKRAGPAGRAHAGACARRWASTGTRRLLC